jgi:hypothetical protein
MQSPGQRDPIVRRIPKAQRQMVSVRNVAVAVGAVVVVVDVVVAKTAAHRTAMRAISRSPTQPITAPIMEPIKPAPITRVTTRKTCTISPFPRA